jgi:anaphase-promoting complex subunit 5
MHQVFRSLTVTISSNVPYPASIDLVHCIITSDWRSPDSTHEALSYLDIAEKDYATLEILRSLADVQFLASTT